MANHFRTDRVGMEIKREVNEILQKKVRDPRVQGVTITDVQMLGDLSMAKVYYTIMSNLASDNQKAQTGLEKATGVVVEVEERHKHSLYGKVFRRSKKVKVHDEHNEAHPSDLVRIMETRPLSATKH